MEGETIHYALSFGIEYFTSLDGKVSADRVWDALSTFCGPQ